MTLPPMLTTLMRLGVWGLHSGLHHLPAEARMNGDAGRALEALLVFDRLLAMEAPLGAISSQATTIGKAWARLSAGGFDPLRVYARATIAKVGPEPAPGAPIVRPDGVMQLPIAPQFLAEAERRALAAESARRYLIGFAVNLFDLAAYDVVPADRGQRKALLKARNVFHASIVFFGTNYEPAREHDVLVSLRDTFAALAAVGLGSDELGGLISNRSGRPASTSSTRRRT